MNGHEHAAPAVQATDPQRQLQQIADLVDEYAELAEPHADLMILLFQLRMVLGDDPAQAGQRISGKRTQPS